MINLKLNGVKIPAPEQDVQIEPIERSRTDRTASFRLVKDLVAIKYRFTLQYSGLLPTDALTFIDIYESGKPAIFSYEDVRGAQSKKVYIQSLPRSIYNPKPEYTKDVTVVLEEV